MIHENSGILTDEEFDRLIKSLYLEQKRIDNDLRFEKWVSYIIFISFFITCLFCLISQFKHFF